MIPTHQVVLVTLLLFSIPSTTTASGCHGMSKFRLAPAVVEPRSAAATGADGAKKKATSSSIVKKTLKEKDALCEEQYGEGSTLMDLQQMEGEFQNPSDLQHALNPLFKENPNIVYLIANRGDDHDEDDSKYILKAHLHPTTTEGEGEEIVGTRVAGQIFLETKQQQKQEQENDDDDDQEPTEILCYIPKPKYTGMMSITTSSSHSVQEKPSSSSWMVSLLSVVAVAAVGVAAFQTYKANKIAATASSINGSSINGPSMDLGGTYSMLSSSEQDLAEQLAPSTSTELV